MTQVSLRFPLALIFAALLSIVMARPAQAHPMGNFSINHYVKIIPGSKTIDLYYIIDMAEIPTFQETESNGLVPKVGYPGLGPYLIRQDEHLKKGLVLLAGGHQLSLETVSRQAIFPAGAGGLPTMKMGFVYGVHLKDPVGSLPLALRYSDGNFPGRAGWKEIVASEGPGAALVNSSASSTDRSLELTNYPTDLLHSPPQTLEAELTIKAAAPGAFVDTNQKGWLTTSVHLAENRQLTPRSSFTELITSQRSDGLFLLAAALIAATLGGFHALEPGHGKTLVAAYLVGSRGTARHAVLLGGIVTASHTISVYALGFITLYASQWIMPEQLYPWLGAASGLLVAGIGSVLFVRRYLSFDQSRHEHQHSEHHHDRQGSPLHVEAGEYHDHSAKPLHSHTWWGGHVKEGHSESQKGLYTPHHSHIHETEIHDHDHPASHVLPDSSIANDSSVSLKSLFILGVTGGIVPCPAALVVLLGALALHRLAFGLFLIVAFSFGLAAVLICLGLVMVYAQRFMTRFGARGPLIERWLPLASSAVITVVGLALTLSALTSAGVFRGKL
jgi:nickel/cobalt transporter (NicO) family protein